MQIIKVVGVKKKVSNPGDFGIALKNGKLEVPQTIMDCAGAYTNQTAAEFFAVVSSFPTSLSRNLNWAVDDVEKAVQKLAQQLTGHVEPALLKVATRPAPSTGAMDPADLKKPTLN